jgi:hypothetical protein
MKVNSRILVSIILACMHFVAIHPTLSQIYLKPDPEAKFDRSKGILIVHSSDGGSFFLNDNLMLKLKANDTAYIINIKPWRYLAKLVTDNDTLMSWINITSGKVLEVKDGKDSLLVKKSADVYEDIANTILGKTVYFFRNGNFYNITQISFYSWNPGDYENAPDGFWFRSFTTINGIQAAPGFCTGVGISYDFYPAYLLGYPLTKSNDENLQFMPLFIDFRFHFPPSKSGKTFPFFKFDIGYNFPIKLSEINSNTNYYDATVTIKKGGVYLSPGFGYRIFLNKLVQITASFEYALMNVKYYYGYNNNPSYNYSKNINCLKICLGVGFQYK